jgi:hypothetical protein
MRLRMLCGTSLALLALAAPSAAQTPASESPGNVAAGEGSATGPSSGGAAPVATRAPAPPPRVVIPAPTAVAPSPTPAIRTAPAPAPAPPSPVANRAAIRRAVAAARMQRAARRARAARAAGLRQSAQGLKKARRNMRPNGRWSAADDEAPALPVAAVAPKADAGSGGFGLTLPLVLLSALALGGLAARHTVGYLRQE